MFRSIKNKILCIKHKYKPDNNHCYIRNVFIYISNEDYMGTIF